MNWFVPYKVILNVALLTLLSAAGWASENELSDRILQFKGMALALDDDRHLYTEYHHIELNDQGEYLRGSVLYRRPDGSRIAEKQLSFEINALLPDVQFRDFRTGDQLGLEKDNGSVSMWALTDNRERQSSIILKKDRIHVADAGFDRLVLGNWNALLKGEEVVFDVLALSSGKQLGFEMLKTSIKDGKLRLKVTPENWFVSFLMDDILLEYDIEQKRLMRYEGITNIASEVLGDVGTSHYQARIEYYYP